MRTFKTSTLAFAAMLATTMPFASCSSDDNETSTENNISYVDGLAHSNGILFENNTQIGNGDQSFVFTGKQTIKKGTYNLKGWVYVADGAELTIEPGTVIKGDKETKASLIIEPGGKAFMKGTNNQPIVMTSEQAPGSRRPGDWGGLIICGKAKNNQGEQQIEGGPRTKHGGNNNNDNSGIFQYVRVEFAGYPFQTDKEINGITLGSVGSGTTFDHIQVSYSNDDSFEWFGGNVNAKYLVAYKGWDDDFDTDNGFSGSVQYGLIVRDPRIADTSQSNAFESDNCADGATVSPFTSAVFSNITTIGPKTEKNIAAGFNNNSTFINGGSIYPDNGSKLGKYQAAIQIRRSSKLNIINSTFVGYPIGLIIDGEKGSSVTYAKNGEFKLQNLVFSGMDVTGSERNKKYEDEYLDALTGKYDASKKSYSTQFFTAQTSNRNMSEASLLLTDPMNVGQNYCPQTGSPLLNSASFEGISNDVLNKVNYIGAFSGTNDTWMNGWTNFDPQKTNY